jgi:hypothetical protein
MQLTRNEVELAFSYLLAESLSHRPHDIRSLLTAQWQNLIDPRAWSDLQHREGCWRFGSRCSGEVRLSLPATCHCCRCACPFRCHSNRARRCLPLPRSHLGASAERQYEEQRGEPPKLDLADIGGETNRATHGASIAG